MRCADDVGVAAAVVDRRGPGAAAVVVGVVAVVVGAAVLVAVGLADAEVLVVAGG
jgi:hypothetical protein